MSLRRVTVNLTERAAAALDWSVEASGDSQTAVINRALLIHRTLEKAVEGGSELCLRRPDGSTETVIII